MLAIKYVANRALIVKIVLGLSVLGSWSGTVAALAGLVANWVGHEGSRAQ
jgi:hypothetical protein